MAKNKRTQGHGRGEEQRTASTKIHGAEALETKVRQFFKGHIRDIKSNEGLDKKLYDGLDFDPVRRKRRTQAIIGTLPKVQTLLSGAVREYPELFTLENDWIDINTLPMTGYDIQEPHTCTAFAASIWILDQLERTGEIRSLDFLLGLAPEYKPPLTKSVWDICHNPLLIEGMLKAIYLRNGDRPNQVRSADGICRLYMTERLAEGPADREGIKCTAYDEVLSHIPRQAIADAVSHYERVYWDWVKRYFLSRSILAQSEMRCLEEMRDLQKEAGDFVAVTEPVLQPALCRIESNLSAVPDFSRSFKQLPGPVTKIAPSTPTRSVDLRKTALAKSRAKASEMIDKLWYFAGHIPKWTYERTKKQFGTEIADIWKDFDSGDPYEMAFAFLYLLDSGSDLSWCYFPGVNLYLASAAKLPRTRLRFNPLNDGIYYHYDPMEGEIKYGPSTGASAEGIRSSALEDWYELRYTNPEEDHTERYNLAQIVYTITGCIMPRKLDRFLPALKTLDHYGIADEQSLQTLLYCMTLLGESRHPSDGPYSKTDEIETDDANCEDQQAITIDALQRQITSLKDELSRQKKLAYESSREAREIRLRCETMAQLAANDRQELYDLRELVFRQQEGSYDDVEPSKDVSFPYSSASRIVVFGGHESWAREIRQKLPTVRFVDRTAAPNANMIRNADIIWIQTNALSHPRFYKIVDKAKKYSVPIRYFSFASPIKCAEQLVREDRKNQK